MRDFSGDITVVVAKHSAEPVAAGDFSFDPSYLVARFDKTIV
jgi:hypothetical protein